MKSSYERFLNEYARLRREAFRFQEAISEIPELRTQFAEFLDQRPHNEQANVPSGRGKSDLVVATIMDEFSNENWSPEFSSIMLSFSDWAREIDYFKPDFLFVESAWLGNFSQWSYAFEAPRIHSNAKEFDKLIEYCRARSIPTVFWNKEDPLHFEKFVEAASLFDLVFTTDADAIKAYKQRLGHDRVFALPFAAQPFLCNPVRQGEERDKRGFFAGSYYVSDHGSRTEQMNMLFDALLEHEGVIYDRAYYSDSPDVKMPHKYQSICEPPVSFDEIVEVYKRHACALNVNSVTQSPTMMSRRVFEALACATPVISTPAKAIGNLLGEAVDQVTCLDEAKRALAVYTNDKDAAARKGHQGYRHVLREHTYNHRLTGIAEALDTFFPEAGFSERVRPLVDKVRVTAILPCDSYEGAKETLASIAAQTHVDLELVVLAGPEFSERDESLVKSSVPRLSVTFVRNEGELSETLQPVLDQSSGGILVSLNEGDVYGKDMLADLLLPLRYTEASIVGKSTYYTYCGEADETWLEAPGHAHKYVHELTGGPVLFTKNTWPLLMRLSPIGATREAFFREAAKLGLRVYSCDPYNVISRRNPQGCDERFLGKGRLSEEVYI